jgi:hypothetical protein
MNDLMFSQDKAKNQQKIQMQNLSNMCRNFTNKRS